MKTLHLRSVLHLFALLPLATLVARGGEASPSKSPMILVNGDQPLAEVIVPDEGLKEGEAVWPPYDCAKTPTVLAEFLTEYIRKSTGVKLTITKEAARTPGRIAIHCGNTEYVRKLNLPLASMDEDEFLIAFPDSKNIVIAANYQHGVEWGVDEFLERYVGVRWLFAGPLGEHIPIHHTLAVAPIEVRSKPAYLSRNIGFDNKRLELGEWARLNRLRRRIKADHNLGVLFPPAKYTASHPEFFPIQNGQRLLPAANCLINWQPCFTAPGIVDEAIKNITEYFRMHPEKQSYSLSVNDNDGYCECSTCTAKDGNRLNYCGRRDHSPSYYEFCNRVAAGVGKVFPTKRFGLYAYGGVAEPPADMVLDEHLVPLITYDRMTWIDPQIEKRGQAITREWAKRCAEIGWYDYLYGDWYLVPRVYFHKMAEYLRYGCANKVRHFYGEVYICSDYREGPKDYLTMKLLWNPALDVDATLKDWYECAVGQDAAPFLAKYFDLWENFWTKRIPQGEFFKANANRTYLEYSDLRYFQDLRAEDFIDGEKLLKRALAATQNEIQRQRVQILLNGLKKSQAVALLHIRFAELNRKLGQARDVLSVNASGFDQNMDDWESWKHDSINARFSWDAGTGHTRPGALLIERLDDRRPALTSSAVLMKPFPVSCDKLYRVSVWVKTVGITPEGKVKMVIHYRGKGGVAGSNPQWIDYMTMTHELAVPKITPGKWQHLELICQVPSEPKIRCLQAILTVDKTNAGKIWFDDFSIAQVEFDPSPDLN